MNPEQLHEELVAAGLPVVGVDALGNVQYSRELTAQEQATAAVAIAAHNPTTGTVRKRAIEAARQLVQSVNGTVVTSLTATQVRNLVILRAALDGWVSWNGTNWVIDISAADLQALLR